MKPVLYTIYWQLKRSIKTMHFNLMFFILGQLIWPMILVGTYYLGYTPLLDDSNSLINLISSEGSLWSFLLPGIIVISLFNQYISIGTHLSFDRDYGILEPIFLSPVNRALWLLGGCTSIIPSGLLSSIGFIVSTHFIFNINIPHPFLLLFAIFIIIILSISWGAMVCSIFLIGRNSRVLYAVFESPAEFLSGARFPIVALPALLSLIAIAYPLSHSVNIIRSFWLKNIQWNVVLKESLTLCVLSIIYIFLALLIFKFAEERGKREGNLTFT